MSTKRYALVLVVFLGLAPALQSANPEAGAQRAITSPFEIGLAWIPPGRYLIGDGAGDGQADEQPQTALHMAGFWAMTTEVTVAMYAHYAQAAGVAVPEGCWEFVKTWTYNQALNWREPGFEQGPNHPVTCLSWDDATAFAKWLSQQTGMDWALPSEAQWEYMARAGSSARYSHGDDADVLCEYSNGADLKALEHYPGFSVNRCDDGFTRTSPVASFRANGFGLFDVHGNVWEWVSDCWYDSYETLKESGEARTAPGCERRAYRGGAYGDIPSFLRVSLRNRAAADERRDDIGLRLVLRAAGPVGSD